MKTPTRLLTVLAALTLVSAIGAAAAYGHAERLSYYPNHKLGSVPKYKRSGPALVVCKANSGARIRKLLSGRAERRNLALLKRCGYRDIQAAVDAAKNGTRILVLPGVYREEPSRRVAERVGFVLEGQLRNAFLDPDRQPADELVFALIPDDARLRPA